MNVIIDIHLKLEFFFNNNDNKKYLHSTLLDKNFSCT
jgi:hypothetical protein